MRLERFLPILINSLTKKKNCVAHRFHKQKSSPISPSTASDKQRSLLLRWLIFNSFDNFRFSRSLSRVHKIKNETKHTWGRKKHREHVMINFRQFFVWDNRVLLTRLSLMFTNVHFKHQQKCKCEAKFFILGSKRQLALFWFACARFELFYSAAINDSAFDVDHTYVDLHHSLARTREKPRVENELIKLQQKVANEVRWSAIEARFLLISIRIWRL